MKTVITLAFLFASTLSFSAPIKIGFVLATMQEERYQKDKMYFENMAKKLGAEVLFASCNNNEQTQSAQVENLIAKGAQAIVIQAVNGETASSFVKQAKKEGIPVVAYDRLITNAPLDGFVTEDARKVGELQAEAAVQFTKKKGKYVILMGTAGDQNAAERTEGVLNVLKKYPEIKVVAQQAHAGWSPELAMKTVENTLTKQKNDVQAVIANNSGMARGAVQALEEQKLTGKVFVAGADADLSAVKDILAGKQQMDVYVSIQDLAEKAVKTAVSLAKKEEFKFDTLVDNKNMKVKTLNTAAYMVNKATLDKVVIQSGFHTREAVYGKQTANK